MKKSRSKSNNKNKILNFIIFTFIIFIIILIYIKVQHDNDPEKNRELKLQEIFSIIDKTNYGNITKYATYGTFLNVEGNINIVKISGINVDYVDLVIKSINGTENQIKSEFI